MGGPMKFNKDSEVIVTRKVNEFIGEDGIRRIRVKKQVLKKPLQLGSLVHPKNTDVIEVKSSIKRKLKNIFGEFFR